MFDELGPKVAAHPAGAVVGVPFLPMLGLQLVQLQLLCETGVRAGLHQVQLSIELGQLDVLKCLPPAVQSLV